MALFGGSKDHTGELEGKFASPHEEIAFLRAQIAEGEKARVGGAGTLEQGSVAQEKVREYRAQPIEKVLAPQYKIQEHEIEAKVLNMGKEHEEAIDELVRVMMARGIKNTLSILEKLNDPHLEDDFHRFLVQFLSDGTVPDSITKERVLFRALRMRLYEVTLPPIDPKGQSRGFADLVTAMERFYAGMLSVEDPSPAWRDVKNYFTLEIALSNYSSEIIFYAAIPTERSDLFEKQVLAVYPDAKLREHKEDYNPFNGKGSTCISVAGPLGDFAFPLKTFDEFPEDPLSVLLGAFSKMKHEGEGASIQIIIRPQGKGFNDRYKGIRDAIKSGTPVKKALDNAMAQFATGFAEVSKEIIFGFKKKDEQPIDQEAVDAITKKISSDKIYKI